MGAPLRIASDWSALCEQARPGPFLMGGSASYVGCDEQRYSVTVECSAPCRVLDQSGRTSLSRRIVTVGPAVMQVIPLAPGPFTFSAVIRRDGSTEEHSLAPTTVVVRQPDRLSLLCYGNDELQPCETQPLSASAPYFVPAAHIGSRRYGLYDAHINSHVGWPLHTLSRFPSNPVYSLAEVAGGNALTSGVYSVHVALGEQSETFAVQVSP